MPASMQVDVRTGRDLPNGLPVLVGCDPDDFSLVIHLDEVATGAEIAEYLGPLMAEARKGALAHWRRLHESQTA